MSASSRISPYRTLARGLAALLLVAAVGGCAIDRRVAVSCGADFAQSGVTVAQSTFDPLASDAPSAFDQDDLTPSMIGTFRQAVRQATREAPGPVLAPVELNVLSLSAGGQFGAFGAGFLRGWAENSRAPRPTFDLVTGVSAGAMLSPIPFSGHGNDAALDSYRGLAEPGVYNRRPLLAALRSDSLADVSPLEALLRTQLTASLIADVAEQHRQGRRLLIIATNLDTTRGTVFDLGAMAASPLPIAERRSCMTEAMLASAAIPGLLPPRNIDGALYADGGLRDQVFLRAVETAREQVAREENRQVRVTATIIVNGSLQAPQTRVNDSLRDYVFRSVVTLSDEVLRDSIAETVEFAESNENWTVRGLVADADLSPCGDETPLGTFDACVTDILFRDGRARGQATPINFMDANDLRTLAGTL